MKVLLVPLLLLCFTVIVFCDTNSGDSDSGGSYSASGYSGSDSGSIADCTPYTNCSTCAPVAGCGWCDATKKCLNGDIQGPDDGLNVVCPTWEFDRCFDQGACQPTNNATISSTCSGCLGTTGIVPNRGEVGCGFCRTIAGSKCWNGTSDGPYGIDANCDGDWVWDGCNLNNDECDQYTNCGNCTQNSVCGWCDNRCLPGTSNGPISPEAFCSVWVAPGTTCLKPCSSYPDCNTCVIEGHCGFCQDQNSLAGTCMEVNLFEPANGTCDGVFYPTQNNLSCPIPSNFSCASFDSCSGCLGGEEDNDLLCAWCETTQTCIDVDYADIECEDRKEGTCESTCASALDCETCSGKALCGWCDNRCVAGNLTEPQNTTCNYYTYHNCEVPCGMFVDCQTCEQSTSCGYCSDDDSTGCFNLTSSVRTTCSSWSETGCPANSGCEDATCESCGFGDFSHCSWCVYTENNRDFRGCYAEKPAVGDNSVCGVGCDSVEPKGLTAGAKAGIAFAVLVVFGLGGLGFYVRHRKQQRETFERLL